MMSLPMIYLYSISSGKPPKVC